MTMRRVLRTHNNYNKKIEFLCAKKAISGILL